MTGTVATRSPHRPPHRRSPPASLRSPPRSPRPRGLALVAVLWIVGALTVLVGGLVQVQRGETRLASQARAVVQGEALGQAAIGLVLQRLVGQPPVPGQRLRRETVAFDGRDIVVETLPATGLLDVNLAPPPMIAAFLRRVGGLDAPGADAVAQAVQARREPASAAGGTPRPTPFDAIEELLLLPGIDPDVLGRIAPFATTDSRGSGRLNPLAAPETVLTFLAAGDAALARRIADERDAGAAGVDTTRLEAPFLDATVTSRYRLTASVPMADGARVLVVREVDATADPAARLPWRTLRGDVRRVAGAGS